MASTLIHCDSCGDVWEGFANIEDSTDIRFAGGRTGPCPKCEGTGTVIDVSYSAGPDGKFTPDTEAALAVALLALGAKDPRKR